MERIWEAPWSTMESTHLISQSSRACDHAIAASKILACANGAAASTKWWTCRNLVYIYIFISCTHDRLLGTHRTFQSASSGVWQALTSLHIFADLSPTCHVRVSRFYSTSVPHYLPTSIFPYLPAPSLPTYLPVTYMHPYIHTHTRIHEYRCSCRVCDHIKSWRPVASRIVGVAQHSRSSTICVTHETTAMFWWTNRLTRFIYGLWCFFF